MPPRKSLIAFTSNIIDYAGLFPPAKLSLDVSYKNYLKYLKGDNSFLLSKFICPVNLLPDLMNLIHGSGLLSELKISVIGRSDDTADEFNKNLAADLTLWKNFSDAGKQMKVTSFEFKTPAEILRPQDANMIAGFMDVVSFSIREQLSESVMLFTEGQTGTDWKKSYRAVINGIEIHNQKTFDTGFKLRTGGMETTAFPSSEQIAFCIRECLDRKVPVKFTAGLHHPFPKYDPEIGVTMHGFINVFAAGMIAMRHDISDIGMAELLNDQDSSNFIFTDEYFSWKDWKVEISDIEFARKNLVLSFGSCSFDEPVEDMTSLNLL